jgi:hypothetical protein
MQAVKRTDELTWEPIRSSLPDAGIVYYRRRLGDRTWLAVSRHTDNSWFWAHYGPHPDNRRAIGIGFQTSKSAKASADRYMLKSKNTPERTQS